MRAQTRRAKARTGAEHRHENGAAKVWPAQDQPHHSRSTCASHRVIPAARLVSQRKPKPYATADENRNPSKQLTTRRQQPMQRPNKNIARPFKAPLHRLRAHLAATPTFAYC